MFCWMKGADDFMGMEKLQPLSELEQTYEEIYHELGQKVGDLPMPFAELERRTRPYPIYEESFSRFFNVRPARELMQETLFHTHNDVEVSMHPRFVPGFLHRHEFFEITYVLQGTCTNIVAGKQLVMQENELCILPPHTEHGIAVCKENDIVMNILVRSSTFDETFFGTLSEDASMGYFFYQAMQAPENDSYLHFFTGGMAVREIILQIMRESREGARYQPAMLNALMKVFFILLLRYHADDVDIGIKKTGTSTHKVIPILRHLQDHIAEITLEELAAKFSYSERQVTRLLKDYTGRNFTQLVQSVRLRKACSMLSNTRKPIHEVILDCGYTNNSYFYRLFAEHYHMTPAAYREKKSKL